MCSQHCLPSTFCYNFGLFSLRAFNFWTFLHVSHHGRNSSSFPTIFRRRFQHSPFSICTPLGASSNSLLNDFALTDYRTPEPLTSCLMPRDSSWYKHQTVIVSNKHAGQDCCIASSPHHIYLGLSAENTIYNSCFSFSLSLLAWNTERSREKDATSCLSLVDTSNSSFRSIPILFMLNALSCLSLITSTITLPNYPC